MRFAGRHTLRVAAETRLTGGGSGCQEGEVGIRVRAAQQLLAWYYAAQPPTNNAGKDWLTASKIRWYRHRCNLAFALGTSRKGPNSPGWSTCCAAVTAKDCAGYTRLGVGLGSPFVGLYSVQSPLGLRASARHHPTCNRKRCMHGAPCSRGHMS